MQIKDLQNNVKRLVAMINSKHKFPFPEIMSLLKAYEEMGEVTELIVEASADTRKGKKTTLNELRPLLGNELADLIIATVSIANDYGINIEKHIKNKLVQHDKRWKRVNNE